MFYWYSCTHLLRLLRDYFRRLRSLVFIDYFFGGGGAIDLILFKSIPYEKLHFASLLYSFVTWGEHKISFSHVSFIGFVHFHLLHRTLSGEDSLPFTAQVLICVKTSVFIPLGSLGFQQQSVRHCVDMWLSRHSPDESWMLSFTPLN